MHCQRASCHPRGRLAALQGVNDDLPGIRHVVGHRRKQGGNGENGSASRGSGRTRLPIILPSQDANCKTAIARDAPALPGGPIHDDQAQPGQRRPAVGQFALGQPLFGADAHDFS